MRPLAFQDRIFIFKTGTYGLEHPKEMKLCISMTHAFVGKSFEMQIVIIWGARQAEVNRKSPVHSNHKQDLEKKKICLFKNSKVLCHVGVAGVGEVAHKVTSPPQGLPKIDVYSAVLHWAFSKQKLDHKSKCEKEGSSKNSTSC